MLVGGSSRNVGKTTFVCKLIEKFSKERKIVGLKIKTIYEGDQFFHGTDRTPLESDFRLVEELDKDSVEDTGKMLRAGAQRTFKLKVKSHSLIEAFDYFKNQLNGQCLIICESNSLRKVVKPAIYLLIKHENEQNMKPSAKELEKFADKIIYTTGENHDFCLEELKIESEGWSFKRL